MYIYIYVYIYVYIYIHIYIYIYLYIYIYILYKITACHIKQSYYIDALKKKHTSQQKVLECILPTAPACNFVYAP